MSANDVWGFMFGVLLGCILVTIVGVAMNYANRAEALTMNYADRAEVREHTVMWEERR
jgi:hypothetical protein